MTIRAVLRNGQIQPIDPLPSGWSDGQELLVEGQNAASADQIDQWERELEDLVGRIPVEEQQRFRQALEDVERESKDAVRREWGLT